jgi:hypothetical protein
MLEERGIPSLWHGSHPRLRELRVSSQFGPGFSPCFDLRFDSWFPTWFDLRVELGFASRAAVFKEVGSRETRRKFVSKRSKRWPRTKILEIMEWMERTTLKRFVTALICLKAHLLSSAFNSAQISNDIIMLLCLRMFSSGSASQHQTYRW